jgi:cell division protein FtsQ
MRRIAWLTVLVTALAIAGFWLRDSSLVRVKNVEVTGITGPDARRVRATLTEAASDMTTLHVRTGQLRTVVEPYPAVGSIAVEADFPSTLKITVHQREPVAAIVFGGSRTAVAADGTILRGTRAGSVPIVPMQMSPVGNRVRGGRALSALRVLGAAPAPLRARVDEIVFGPDGLALTLVRGPELRFGATARPKAKWLAAARVLADPLSKGATYIDVRYPERPAAGGLEDPAKQSDPRSTNEAVSPPQGAEAAPVATALQH